MSILDSINHISDYLLKYAITLAAVAALTMALLEAWKKLFDTMAKFNRRSILGWVQDERGKSGKHYLVTATKGRDYVPNKAYSQLLLLTTGVGEVNGDYLQKSVALDKERKYDRSIEFALFELEIDRLMGQIQDASDVALNNPAIYRDLFLFLTRSALKEDVEKWQSDVRQSMSAQVNDENRKELADRYARLKQIVRRHLDSFQIVTAMRWREWNQFYAIVVGALLLALAHLIPEIQKGALSQLEPSFWVNLIGSSLFGGMLAPVAKDLVDALGKVKSRV